MKKITLLLISTLTLMYNTSAQDIWKTSKGTISFFSHAPLEDIFAESKKMSGAINTKTNTVAVVLNINTLKMENSLQQEHLNEKYLESDKFPKGSFKGKFANEVDWTKDGIYDVSVVGTLELHGVALERTIPVTITIKDSKVSAASKFKVKVADHKIDIPTLVFQKVAEEVEISLNAEFVPYEKK